jgi:hypothetical protein
LGISLGLGDGVNIRVVVGDNVRVGILNRVSVGASGMLDIIVGVSVFINDKV